MSTPRHKYQWAERGMRRSVPLMPVGRLSDAPPQSGAAGRELLVLPPSPNGTDHDISNEAPHIIDVTQSSARWPRSADELGAGILGPIPDDRFRLRRESDDPGCLFRPVGKYPVSERVRAVRGHFRGRHHHREFCGAWLCVGRLPDRGDQEHPCRPLSRGHVRDVPGLDAALPRLCLSAL